MQLQHNEMPSRRDWAGRVVQPVRPRRDYGRPTVKVADAELAEPLFSTPSVPTIARAARAVKVSVTLELKPQE